MKTLLFVLTILLSMQVFAAEFKSNDDILKKLASHTVEDIKGDAKRVEAKEKLKIDEMFDDLEAAAKFIDKSEVTEDMAVELERVCLITFLHDPTTLSADLIIKVYDRNQSVFKKAAKRLHPYDMGIILEVLRSKNEVSKNGQD
ncbi:MAG: hypothetical protein H7326_03150 [Bdellovibrionaceae bacterium]|nr:hypothetical protein [Pseudobdellovibrionaceae bacterium]